MYVQSRLQYILSVELHVLLVLTTVVPLIYVQLKIQLQISYLCSVLTTVDPLVYVQFEKQ